MDAAKVKEDPWILSTGYGRKCVIARLRTSQSFALQPTANRIL
jgi:hypothetical protein